MFDNILCSKVSEESYWPVIYISAKVIFLCISPQSLSVYLDIVDNLSAK